MVNKNHPTQVPPLAFFFFFLSLFKNTYLSVYLTAPGLSYNTEALEPIGLTSCAQA